MLEDELKKELSNFVYQHEWNSECQVAANYTGFHMINVILEKLKSHNKEYIQDLGDIEIADGLDD
jgi:hypothetical protein